MTAIPTGTDQEVVDGELSRRSLTGAWALTLGGICLLFLLQSEGDSLGITRIILVLSIFANFMRLLLATFYRRVASKSYAIWRSLFFGLSVGNAASWGLGSGYLLQI